MVAHISRMPLVTSVKLTRDLLKRDHQKRVPLIMTKARP